MPPHGEYIRDVDHIFAPSKPPETYSGRALSIAIRGGGKLSWFDRAGGPEGAATFGGNGCLASLEGTAQLGQILVEFFRKRTDADESCGPRLPGSFCSGCGQAIANTCGSGSMNSLTGNEHLFVDWMTVYPTGWGTPRAIDCCLSASLA